jgi:hypothetical protein
MSSNTFLPDESGSTRRPDLLAFLAVLGFLNTAFFGMIYAIGVLTMLVLAQMPLDEYLELFTKQMASWPSEMEPDQMLWLAELLHAHGALLMGVLLARTVARFVGIFYMWRGRKLGFHIYAASQLIGIFAPHIVLPLSLLGVGGPLLAVGMTALYGTQVKRMGS